MGQGHGANGVVVEARGHVRLLRLARPEKLNALDPMTSIRCRDFFRAAADDPDVRAVIVTGTGDRAFCAGFDLSTVAAGAFEQWDVSIGGLTKDVLFPKPVICAVNGLAYGGGCELVLASDLRVAVPSATFAFPEVRHGLIAGGGGTVRLPDQIPWAVASEMLLRSRILRADEALTYGLLNAVVPAADLMDTAWAWAEDLAERSPQALRYTKESMWRSRGMDMVNALELEERYSALVQRSDEAKRGVDAFVRRQRERG